MNQSRARIQRQPLKARAPAVGTESAAPTGAPRLQRARQLQRAVGNTQLGRMGAEGGLRVQPKLIVGSTSDPAEQEADRVATAVMRMPEGACCADCAGGGSCDTHAGAEAPGFPLRRMPAAPDRGLELGPDLEPAVRRATSGGEPLPDQVRAKMEPRFGQDLSNVRIHRDADAANSAQALGAKAYTLGDHIAFGRDQYAPGTASGDQLIAHELTHVQGQGMGEQIERAPGEVATAPVKALESLEAVAQRIARLAVGPRSAKVNLKGGPGPVVSVVRNLRTGDIYVGLNTGTPVEPTRVIDEGVKAQEARIKAGEVKVVVTDAIARGGGHAEVNALNRAIAAEEVALGRAMTEAEITATFEMHNVWLKGKRKFTTAGRCEHCRRITRGVSVTQSLFKAEGGVSGEINVPQRGKVVKTGGKTVEAGTIHGEIPASKPVPEVKVGGGPSVGKSAVKLVVTQIALNVLLFAVTYFISKWRAEKQARKFNSDLEDLLPEVNTSLKNKEAEIEEKGEAFPLVYGNITIAYTHDNDDPEGYNEGSMRIQDVAISHQNYQTPERLIKYDFLDSAYSRTFSVPLFEESTAEKGASSSVRNYRQVRENLTHPGFKVRLNAVFLLHKLVTHDSSLETLVVRDLLGMLKDEDALVRLVAAAALSDLKAKIAIQYIRAVIPITSDDKHKESLQRYLRQLEQVEAPRPAAAPPAPAKVYGPPAPAKVYGPQL
jgi:hypothetical protein